MKAKTLNHLIITLSAALLSVLLTATTILLIPQKEVLLKLALQLLASIADLFVVIDLYQTIKSAFNHQSKLSILVATLGALILAPLWFGFKLYVFEGTFNVGNVLIDFYLALKDNVEMKLIGNSVTYFSKTLFSEADVATHFIRYLLIFLTDFITTLAIPFVPAVLMIKDMLRGTEVYEFSRTEEQQDESKL